MGKSTYTITCIREVFPDGHSITYIPSSFEGADIILREDFSYRLSVEYSPMEVKEEIDL